MNKHFHFKKFLAALALLLGFTCFSYAQDKDAWEAELEKALANEDWTKAAEASYRLGVYYDNNDSLAESISMGRNALIYAQKGENRHWRAMVLNFLGSVYSLMGTADSINEMLGESVSLFLLEGDTSRAANVMLNLGMEYVNAGAYEKALEIKQKALYYKVECGDSTNIAFFFQQIGEVYSALHMSEKWKYYLEIARELSQNQRYAKLITRISVLNDLGGIYNDESNYDAALNAFQEMISLSIANNYPKGVATANSNLVEVYLALNDPDKALKAALKSYEMSKGANAYRQISAADNLAMCYLKLNQTEKALAFFRETLAHPSIKDYSEEYLSALKGISKTYARLGIYKEAFYYNDLYFRQHDSLNNIEVKKNISLLETQFRTKDNEQQIKLLSAENELQAAELNRTHLQIIGIISVFLLLSVIALLLFRQHRLSENHRQIALEQKLLRSQMNPHFIFNALSAIQQYLIGGDSAKASDYLGRFASLIRSVLKSSREDWISLSEEISMIQIYLDVQKIRFQDHLHYTLETDKNIESDIILVPPLLVQPFIENAIEHGIRRSEVAGGIAVSIKETTSHLIFEVEDDGPGFSVSQDNAKHISYALSIFKERVYLLNKRLAQPLTYEIQDKKTLDPKSHGVLVRVQLPIVTKSDI